MEADDEEPEEDVGEPTPQELLEDLLADQEGARCPGTPPCLALEDPAATEGLDGLLAARARERIALLRRGADHGHVVRLAPLPDEGPASGSLRRRRWTEARGLPLPGLLDGASVGRDPHRRREQLDVLARPGGLRRALSEALRGTRGAWEVLEPRATLQDPERDLERVALRATGLVGRPELWAKSGRLSTHAGDRSLRVRLGFGAEGADDASRDRSRLLAVRDLAELLFPECVALHRHPDLTRELEPLLGGPPLFTQHIAYWNAPQGGALFHHDAFDEPEHDRQQAVCYVQLVGRTFWLVLPIEELAQHVASFVRDLGQGELPWVREALAPDPATWSHWLAACSDPLRLVDELALPGQGRFAPLVNQGPEFTAQLVDAGHGLLLEPGDGLLLPNHGYARTAMHSVWCADDGPTFALSLAVRRAGAARAGERGTRGRPGRGRGRRRGGGRSPRRSGG